MEEILKQLLILAYASVGVIGIVAYWPTIRDLCNNKPSANISSYIIWVATNFVTFLYALFVLDDLPVRIVSGAYFFVNSLVLFLRIRVKDRTK